MSEEMNRHQNLDNSITRTGFTERRNAQVYSVMPLNEFIEEWLTVFKQGTVKPSTFQRLRQSYKALRDHPIADLPIGEITSFDIQAYVNDMTKAGYGLTTIKKQLLIVTAPLRQAAASHYIQADPSVGVKLPSSEKVLKPPRDTDPYSPEEQEALWKEILADRDEADSLSGISAACAVGLMLETGMRVGETLALDWRKVDIPRKRLQVSATLCAIKDRNRAYVQESPKTQSSKRVVPLSPRAIQLLTKMQELQTGEWVFPGSNNHRLTYDDLRRYTKTLCEKAGVPFRGEHVFRHTFATNCYYRQVDVKVLSRILGHADVQTTYNIYITLQGDGFEDMYSAVAG